MKLTLNGRCIVLEKYYGTINFKELIYVFFRKKECPVCNNKMESEYRKKYIGITGDYIASGYAWDSETYKVIHCYHCSICNKTFYVSELIKNEKDIKCIDDDNHNDNSYCL